MQCYFLNDLFTILNDKHYHIKNKTIKPKSVGDPTSKGSFTLEHLRLGLDLNVSLQLGFDIIIILP